MANSEEQRPAEDFSDFQNPSSASVDRLVQALDKAYHRPGLLMWRSFLSGIFYSFGVTFGFILVFILTAFIVRSLGGISLLQPVVNKLDDMVLSHTTSNVTNQQQSIDQLLQKYTSPTPTP